AVEVARTPVRTLVELASENAVEGCVRETYGAAVAAWQGQWAGHASVRRVMRSIAIDEAEHAALGWAVDAWARSRLSRAGRAALDDCRACALTELRDQIGEPVATESAIALGLPGREDAAKLVSALEPLWG